MEKASRKKAQREEVKQTRSVTVGDVLVEVGAELRELMMKGGLAIAAALFTEEIAQLCGPRYGRGEGLASRWGTRQGEVVLSGRKVKLPRPRVRQQGREVELETYRRLQAEDPLSERALEQMLVGVSTRKYARSLEPVPAVLEEAGTSKSAVSRRFVAKTQEQLGVAPIPWSDADFYAVVVVVSMRGSARGSLDNLWMTCWSCGVRPRAGDLLSARTPSDSSSRGTSGVDEGCTSPR